MRKELLNKNWIRFALVTCLVILPLCFGNYQALAQSEPEGEDPVAARRDLDKEQIDAEAKELANLQKKDYEECEEDNDTIEDPEESSGQGPQNRSNDPYDPSNPDNPNGDIDGDGVPNSQDPYDNRTDPATPTVPPEPVSPACADGDTAGYIAANEGVRNTAYTDSEGYKTIGIGHKVTGNEPFPCDGTITDEQVGQLYDADTTTARNCARRSAAEHGVDYDALSPERQTVVTDMSFNMGCQGNGGINEFDKMWGNMADAQRTGSQDSWDAAGDEIMDSKYGDQTGNRAPRNADIMRTSDGSKIDEQIAQDPDAQGYCGGGTTAWARPLELFAKLFQAPLALAQTYVPVQEQKGPLMDHAKAIETNTEDTAEDAENIRLLSIQICTHLKAIHRIQERFELKMVEDATVMKIKSTEIEKYRQAMFGDKGVTKKGGSRIDKDGKEVQDSPLYVENNKAYWEAASNEAQNIAFAELANSSNVNIGVIVDNLKNDNSVSIESDITDEELSALSGSNPAVATADNEVFLSGRIPIFSSLLNYLNKPLAFLTGKNVFAQTSQYLTKSDDFWTGFRKLAEPKNNRFGSYLIAADQVEIQKNIAVQAARDEALQGQGFLGMRTCAIKSADGKECAVWKTGQPGIIVKETQAAAMNARLDMYKNADQMGEIDKGSEPDVNELTGNTPNTSGGGAEGPGMTTPDGVPDTVDGLSSDPKTNVPPDNGNTDGGGNGESGGGGGPTGDGGIGGTDWTDLINRLGGLYDESDSADPGSDPVIQAILQLLKILLDNSRPWIIFKAKDRGNDSSLVYWYAPNASDCVTTNEWKNGDGTKIKNLGASLTISSSTRVTIKSGESGSYQIKCTNSRGSRERTLPIKRD